MTTSVGIWSIGTYLPPIVRTNDWWPAEIVERWRERRARSLTRAEKDDAHLSVGAGRVLAALAEVRADPFEGSVSRRVLSDDMRSSDMELAAARMAIERAGIDRREIDLVLSQSTTPDYLHMPNPCLLHRELGLPRRCFTLATEGMCNAFLQQLVIAEQMILTGRARCALLIQSSYMTCFMNPEEQFSPWFGDAATAAIVGPVPAGYGILGHTHITDGQTFASIVTGVPDGRWYEGGSLTGYLANPAGARGKMLSIVDLADEVVGSSLADAKLNREEVDFWACHQAWIWLGRVTQEHLGLRNAARVDTFAWAGSVIGCNLPLVLSVGLEEGSLRDGHRVALFTGGAGITASGMVLRWGTGR